MLKITEIELELISDIDMYSSTEKVMIGGISYIAKRFSKANNKYMQFYDDKKPSKYIIYLDQNNLYGWAMSQYLPYGRFKWLNQKEIDKFCLNSTGCNSIEENSSDGYILEVDLEYPDKLQELHNDYLLAPEKLETNHNMLSDYCSNIANEYGIKTDGVNKLVPNLGNKCKYVLHYRNLPLYLSLEMKLTKVRRVLKFKHSDWLKKCIDFNTEKRKPAANSFEKDFFKLMNNSVFGKTMENVRKRTNVRLVNSVKDYMKYTSKPSFVSQKIFSKTFVAIREIKPVLTPDKPIYVGFSILDLSKLLMCEFRYCYIKRKYNANLLFSDTDSLVHEIATDNVYEDKDLFDLSDYLQGSTFFDPANKKVIGKMKDEFRGKIISEVVGLKSNMYSLGDVDNEENKKAKGVNKNVIKNIRHKEYLDVLFNKKMMRHKMKRIQSKLHKIRTYDVCKILSSCFDDQRYILGDGINSLTYFHKDVKSQ